MACSYENAADRPDLEAALTEELTFDELDPRVRTYDRVDALRAITKESERHELPGRMAVMLATEMTPYDVEGLSYWQAVAHFAGNSGQRESLQKKYPEELPAEVQQWMGSVGLLPEAPTMGQ